MSLLEQVVKIREQILAEDHPSRLASQHQLAIFHWQLGHQNTSIQLMQRVVDIQQQVLDEQHPHWKASEIWLDYLETEMASLELA